MKTPSKSVAAKPRAKTRRPAPKRAAPAARKPSNLPRALPIVEAALADMKAVDVRVIDVRGLSDVADFMVIASGTSDRHLRSVADRVVQIFGGAGLIRGVPVERFYRDVRHYRVGEGSSEVQRMLIARALFK
jgi:alkylation response protein AidB-like acyl-CoA dehydrogenase